jgi:hypothetical protein
MENTDWHMFDVQKDYEVRTVFGIIEVRQYGEIKARLTPEEFNKWREKGINPEGLD